MILFIILPAMLGLILLRTPIVHVFFEHGTFTAADTKGTALAVLCYAVGLWAFAGVRIIVSAFYSMQDTRTPAFTAVVAVLANLVLSLVFMDSLRHAGLALATALAGMLNVVILVAILNRRLGGVDWSSVIRSSGRVLLASLPVILICVWVADLDMWNRPGEWESKLIALFVAVGISMAGYVGLHALMKSEELVVLQNIVKGKFRRRIGSR
jgi:putative peptidoglycan lipid II flippase